MSTLNVGDAAPDFSLEAQDGSTVKLSDYRDKQAVVLIFYPMDRTPGCTKQLCAARDDYDRYVAAGIAVFGVNGGGADAHRKFVAQYRLKTPLLVDTGLRVSSAYDAVAGFGPMRLIKRTVVGVAPDGAIAYYRRGMPSTDEIIASTTKAAATA
jgi:thioredoxin-dependent peroxiredoxin